MLLQNQEEEQKKKIREINLEYFTQISQDI